MVSLFSHPVNMRFYQREIAISLLALLITAAAIGHFIKGVTSEKEGTQHELYLLLDSAPSALLFVNKPSTFHRMMLSQEKMKQVFIPYIPEIYLNLISQIPSLSSVLFSFQEQQVIMYAKVNGKESQRLDKALTQRFFPIYMPYTQEKEGIRYTFYPDTAGRYFGCYQHQNTWVASYSKHLLEQVAKRQLQGTVLSDRPLKTVLQSLDRQAPVNLVCHAQPLNLYVAVNDSTRWQAQSEWIAADIYSDREKLCCIGNITCHFREDSLYASLADTLSCRLQQLFPGLQIQSHADVDQEQVYLTSCATPIEP